MIRNPVQLRREGHQKQYATLPRLDYATIRTAFFINASEYRPYSVGKRRETRYLPDNPLVRGSVGIGRWRMATE
ncbi:hypothetical protein [Marinimicrobium agarilyticum]|uniref:hypothetical protein n=1 Tax=Marinimicrobium agarilyticum TaxID=306546 RepID=UPI000481E1E9|nr:hypothetical protein [Marinimicrobium agarilyticum]